MARVGCHKLPRLGLALAARDGQEQWPTSDLWGSADVEEQKHDHLMRSEVCRDLLKDLQGQKKQPVLP